MCAACALHVRCMCAACALHVRCMCAACALHVRPLLMDCLCGACGWLRHCRASGGVSLAIVAVCAVYTGLGTLMFGTFLPWT
jgi:hypothetical protein